MAKSKLEQRFLWWLGVLGKDLPPHETEYRFHPSRRWRFDFAWPDQKIAVEIDGGQWSPHGGRHNTTGDREKLNEAARLGWRILRFDGSMIRHRVSECIEQVRQALQGE